MTASTGTVSIAKASLGWRKPVHLEGVTLKGLDGETVVSISKIETQASLWSMVRGKTGFGATLSFLTQFPFLQQLLLFLLGFHLQDLMKAFTSVDTVN